MSDAWTIYTDGGSRGNPGPAAYAYVIKRPGQLDIEEKCYLGKTTNNIAEYTGLVKALEHATRIGGKKLIVCYLEENLIRLWDRSTGKVVREYSFTDTEDPKGPNGFGGATSASTRLLLYCSRSKSLRPAAAIRETGICALRDPL